MSKSLLQIIAIWVLALFTMHEAAAFSTFTAAGGTIHLEIITAALVNDPAIKISQKSLQELDLACSLQDTPGTDGFTDPSHHFCNCKISESLDYIESCYKEIGQHLDSVDKKESEWKIVLKQFGLLLHTVQDFYAHSNYVEQILATNDSLAPSSIPLVNWQGISKGIRTGYFFYRSSYENESASYKKLGKAPDHDTISTCLVEDKDVYPGTTYLKKIDYDKIKDFKDRLAYVNNPKLSVLHRDSNKDGPAEEQGKIVNPKTNISLYAYARALAIRDTKRQWQRLETMTREKCPQKADAIINILKNGFPEKKAVEFQRPKFGKLISIPLSIRNDSGGPITVWTLGTDRTKESYSIPAGGLMDQKKFPAWLQINDKVMFQMEVPPNRFGVSKLQCSWDYITVGKPYLPSQSDFCQRSTELKNCKPYLLYDGNGNRADVRDVDIDLDPAKMKPWLKD